LFLSLALCRGATLWLAARRIAASSLNSSGFSLGQSCVGALWLRLPRPGDYSNAASNPQHRVHQEESEMIRLSINGKSHQVDVEPNTPLLWVIREQVGLTGTKYGCGIAQCGACTVHLDGAAVRSCSIPVSAAVGKRITTIEGLASGKALHRVQKAWLEHEVPQCGYCQSGMIMAAAALLASKPKPTDADIDASITNICRCGTFQEVRKAIHAAARTQGSKS
jgi:isoquinoline 1-oxidoreductase alpha subunit